VIESGALPNADFRAALARGFLMLDAAMGTRLLQAGLRLDDPHDDPCLWNLTHSEAVLAIHRRDAAAGAELLLTNTFGANRRWLKRLGGEAAASRVKEVNQAGVALARQAAGPGRFVVGDIGPTAAAGAGDAVAEQAALLTDFGIDALLFETHRLDQAEQALREVGRCPRRRVRVPLMVSLLDWPDPPDRAVAHLAELGAEAVGVNCQEGMDAALRLAERLRRATALPLIVKPAAGGRVLPAPEGTPEAFAGAVPRLRALRPVLVGGCCGTSEAHLAAVRAAWYDSEGLSLRAAAPGVATGDEDAKKENPP
jgi:methionine synthase I (cobalamin-dependent)